MSPRRIVHLVVDDKFIDAAIREFEAVAPGCHDYLVLGSGTSWRHLRSTRVQPLQPAQWSARVRQPDVAAVVLHGLMPQHYALLAEVPPEPTVVWLGWGYDYYGLLADAFPQGLLLPATAALMSALQPRSPRPVDGMMRASELSVARPYAKPSAAQRAALRRVDIFSPVLDDEVALVRRHQPWFTARHLPWNYLTLEDDLEVGPPNATPPGPNLLVGNSATATNNHLEAFELVRRCVDLAGRQVVVPLSYGDPAYAREIVKAGRRLFGDAFVPLLEFLPRERYIELLDSCGIVVMNHLRQQALGNVVIAGLRGARLFLNPANPMTRWLHRQGVPVDDIGTLTVEPLAPAQRRRQREAIVAFTCRAHRRAHTAALVATLLDSGPLQAKAA